MARPQSQKRHREEDLLLDKVSSKKTKTRVNHIPPPAEGIESGVLPQPSTSQRRKRQADSHPQGQASSKKPISRRPGHVPENFPPEFYDNLPHIWLTRRAVRELDRRNACLPPPRPQPTPVRSRSAKLAALARLGVQDLAIFATAGGPDLSDLQGYPEPINAAMSSTKSPPSSKPVSAPSAPTPLTKVTTPTLKSKRSSAYDANFGQHCINHSIYPPAYKFPNGKRSPKPANFDDIRQALNIPRRSLSPSLVPETAFEDFQEKNATQSESAAMRNVIPLIAGNADILNTGDVAFSNLDSITGTTTVCPKPDFFDGAHPAALDRKVWEDLDKIIIPNKKVGVPVAPNFFLEVKTSEGSLKVASWQAILDGAHGALIMHSLQNYLLDEPVYDGNAYAFTSTLLAGFLTLHAHHLTAPAEPGQTPGYHATVLKAYALIDDEVYSEGRAAFRNLRVRAKEDRDRFIDTANARARNLGTEDATGQDSPAPLNPETQDEASSPLNFYECQAFTEPKDRDHEAPESQGTQTSQETHETEETEEANIRPPLPEDASDEDPTDDTNVLTSFTATSVSNFPTVQSEDYVPSKRQPKKTRSPPSPSSSRRSKRRIVS